MSDKETGGHSQHEHPKLGAFFSTAISGNDILSSALYVSGIAIIFAGVYAPLVLLFIGVVLFLYRFVYIEVVEALPVNGGAYNCLLNGTSKTIAATAGVMTLLSYVATAVISAKTGIEYLHTVFPSIPVIPTTIGLLGIFALLVISGIKDSAKVAAGIFTFHILSLTVFVGLGAWYWLHGGQSFFMQNADKTKEIVSNSGNIFNTLYLAFSACLLGVSGFESSANFVEEQQKGVFRKTLTNMLVGVTIFNPLIALIVLYCMPFVKIAAAKDFLISDAALIIGGKIFQYVIVADAALVLAGAVLTSFVGVSGLLNRMTNDGCFPSFLAKENKKGSFPRIIIAFFLLCSSILIATKGELLSLAGVYTIAFLGVMSLFAIGNLILKESRTELKRTFYAPTIVVFLAFLSTFFGILGNIRIDPNNLRFFEIYFIPTISIVLTIIYQDRIITALIRLTRNMPGIQKYLNKYFKAMAEGHFVAFIHHENKLYAILDYINRNEVGTKLTLVHCPSNEKDDDYEGIKKAIPVLQESGAFSHFDIEVKLYKEPFGPEMITKVSKDLKIPKNRIMIGSIHEEHPYDYDDLGGVRIIV